MRLSIKRLCIANAGLHIWAMGIWEDWVGLKMTRKDWKATIISSWSLHNNNNCIWEIDISRLYMFCSQFSKDLYSLNENSLIRAKVCLNIVEVLIDVFSTLISLLNKVSCIWSIDSSRLCRFCFQFSQTYLYHMKSVWLGQGSVYTLWKC